MFTLLIVEDEALIRFGLKLDLEETGYTVLDASNADEAIALLAGDETVRIVITDIDMPGRLDGLGLTKHVAATRPGLPVILVSGKTSPGAGVLNATTRFLAKPFQLSDLLRLVEDLTEGE